MKIIENPTRDSILRSVEEWIDLLAREDYSSAAAFLGTEVDSEWTPDLLRKIIQDHRVHREQVGPSKVSRALETTGGLTPRHEVNFASEMENVLAEVWYDVPLLGEWSDLTATFLLKETVGGAYLVLENLHMM
ncbi:hypothetical protein JST97_03940 [bacterium]|nr:hypothetical protein [bacterium]